MSKPRLLLAGTIGAIAVGTALVAVGFLQPLREPCALQDRAFLSARDVPGFRQILNSDLGQPPFLDRNEQFMATFDGLRSRGFIAEVAFADRYRKYNDARARSLNYPSSSIPIVPLEGPVVQEHSGVLEIYQTNWAFKQQAAADNYLAILRRSESSNEKNGSNSSEVPSRLGDVSFATSSVEGPNDGAHEHVFSIAVRRATNVATVTVRGGSALTFSAAEKVATAAVDLVDSSCGE